MPETANNTAGQTKQQRILKTLRGRIFRGDWGCGHRLPPHRELAREFGVSLLTLQRALDQLGREGFVVTSGRRGTFVADAPPSLHRYGLALPTEAVGEDGHGPRSAFRAALLNEMLRVQQTTERRIAVYYGIDGHTDAEDYQRLLADLDAHRLSGLVMVDPSTLAGTPVLDYDIPMATLGGNHRDGIQVPAVWMNRPAARTRACELLRANGCQRVAILTIDEAGVSVVHQLRDMLAEHGLSTEPGWIQGLDPYYAHWAEGWVQLLMRADDRPDGLIITDDHLVDHAVRGLVRAGVRVPDALQVVGHCNFPSGDAPALPIQRIGFDVRHVVAGLFDLLDRQRRGEAITQVAQQAARVEALWEHEVEPTSPITARR